MPAKAFCQSGSTAGASGTNVEITVVGDRAAEPQVEPWLAVEPVFPDSLRVTMHGRRPAPWVFTRPPGWLDFLPEMYWSMNGGDSTGVGAWTQQQWTDLFSGQALFHAPRLCAPLNPGCTWTGSPHRFDYGGDTSNDFDAERNHYVAFLQGFRNPEVYPNPACQGTLPYRLPDNGVVVTYNTARTIGTTPGIWPTTVGGTTNYAIPAYPPNRVRPYQFGICTSWSYLYRIDVPKVALLRGIPAFQENGHDRIMLVYSFLIPDQPWGGPYTDPPDTQSIWGSWSHRGRFANPTPWYGPTWWSCTNPADSNPPPPTGPNLEPCVGRSKPGGFRISDATLVPPPPPGNQHEWYQFPAMSVAPATATPRPGTIYVGYVWRGNFEATSEEGQQMGPGRVIIERSTDGGTRWRNDGDTTFGPDAGGPGVRDVLVREFRYFQKLRVRPQGHPYGTEFTDAPPFISIAADPYDSNIVYVAWSEMKSGPPGVPGDTDVWFGRVIFPASPQQPPNSALLVSVTQINDDTGTADQFMPAISVDASGTLWVIWYDRRDDPANQMFHVYYARSSDRGDTWSSNQRLTLHPSDPLWAHTPQVPPPRTSNLGEYNGAASATIVGAHDEDYRIYQYSAFTANPRASSGENTDIHFVPLHANALSVSPSRVGWGAVATVTFSLNAGTPNAGRFYRLLGSSTGTSIGFNFLNSVSSCPTNPTTSLSGVVCPLTPYCSWPLYDFLFCNTYFAPSCAFCVPCIAPLMSNFSGTLNAQGVAFPPPTITANFPLGYVGGGPPVVYYFAFVLDDPAGPWNYCSNVVTLTVQ